MLRVSIATSRLPLFRLGRMSTNVLAAICISKCTDVIDLMTGHQHPINRAELPHRYHSGTRPWGTVVYIRERLPFRGDCGPQPGRSHPIPGKLPEQIPNMPQSIQPVEHWYLRKHQHSRWPEWTKPWLTYMFYNFYYDVDTRLTCQKGGSLDILYVALVGFLLYIVYDIEYFVNIKWLNLIIILLSVVQIS